jgi:hypothetical protein
MTTEPITLPPPDPPKGLIDRLRSRYKKQRQIAPVKCTIQEPEVIIVGFKCEQHTS